MENKLNSNISKRTITLIIICVLFVLFILVNSYTIVDAGKAKVQTTFGKVNPQPYTEGFHFPVNPLSTFDTYDTREYKYEVSGLNIPTQDRFNSTANVTVLLRVPASETPSIKVNYGSMDSYIDKTLRQYLRSIIRDEGRKMSDSRSLAVSSNVTDMQLNTQIRLTKALSGNAIEIREVLVQDITFDPRIAKQILETQERIQREEAEKSKLRMIETQAQQVKAQAQGAADAKREQANAEQYRIEALANAQAHKIKTSASAERYALEQRAEGNNKLKASLTTEILKLKELDVRLAEAGEGWNGQLPANFSPVYGNGKDNSAPFLLKNLQ